jgi:two-component system phosphate regulon sensor histidine kinase PhoR
LDALAESQGELRQLNAELETRVEARTAELHSQKTYLQTILDAMDEGVLYGTDAEIYYVNRKMQTMSGYDASDLIAQPRDLLFPDLAQPRQRASADEFAPLERRLRRKDGVFVDVAITTTPAVELDGKIGSIAIVRDITEEKALQERRDRFLANASHELRTPLANLMTRLYLLRKQPEQLENHLQILDQVSQNMKNLVEDLLDVSRFKRGIISLHREKLSMQALIGEVIHIQRQEAANKDIALDVHMPESTVYAFLDRKRFTQVLVNLVINAITYTPNGGHVGVYLREETDDNLHYGVIEVRDDGIGIDEAHLPQIFQPFFRASQEIPGTGLGLTIVKEIVEQHGGEINVASEPGSGTVFRVRVFALTQDELEEQPVA